jgi:hypothetical protein
MKYSIQAVSAEGSHVELRREKDEGESKNVASLFSKVNPLAFIHVYIREPFQIPGGEPDDQRFRLSLIAKFNCGEEVK